MTSWLADYLIDVVCLFPENRSPEYFTTKLAIFPIISKPIAHLHCACAIISADIRICLFFFLKICLVFKIYLNLCILEVADGLMLLCDLSYYRNIQKTHFKLTLTMAKIRGAVTVNEERCKGCNLCVVACPTDTLALQPNEVNDRGYHFAFMIHPEACIGCSSCALVCPDACIEVYRVKID